MKHIATLLVLIFLFPSISYAAQIFGNVRKSGGAVVLGTIDINCGGKVYRGNTDGNGSYSIFVQQQEKCSLTLVYENKTSKAVPVFSYSDPTRYDFELLPSGDLKRR
jgi:hypothetical protein